MQIPTILINQHAYLGKQCILHVYRGSYAHGMYIPSSNPSSIDDIDTMAITVPSIEHYLGLKSFGSRGTKEIKQGEWDIVVYEVRKAISLLSQGNPNILSLLWTDKIIKSSLAGRYLIRNRVLFSCKQVYRSFEGYARSQLKKMTQGAYQGYMGEKRKAMVDKFGYDTKNAAHLIRLLRMGNEFLVTGELAVDRSNNDADYLLQIKKGYFSLNYVKDLAIDLFSQLDQSYRVSSLPERPDIDKVNKLCVNLILLGLLRQSVNFRHRVN